LKVLLLLCAIAGSASAQNVAVFNFQMKSDTPEWVWLEKGLADRIATDFVRGRSVTVLARDQMQVVAQQVRWRAEMADRNEHLMREVKEELKIEQIVSGVYSVAGERITITAQVLDVDTRRELFRKEISGAASDVLNLQRQLSAELLAHFSGKKAGDILTALPAWTQSLPASKALYEGMDLFDQGRYAEAWLLFRKASRDDPGYLEAGYWVGRMYYFMNRYEHARAAYERFVHMDAMHPRIGDAVKEYLHTYEQLGAEPGTLLQLYADFARRFPDAWIYNELGLDAPVPARIWLRARSGQLLQQMGRYEEASIQASAAEGDIIRDFPDEPRSTVAFHVAMGASQTLNLLTGRVFAPPGLELKYKCPHADNLILFKPGQTEVKVLFDRPEVIASSGMKDARATYCDKHIRELLMAPDGYVFKKLACWPILDGEDAWISCYLNKDWHLDVGPLGGWIIAKARTDGYHFEQLPHSGIFELMFYMWAQDRYRDPKIQFRGIRVLAELEKTGATGAIDVACSNTSSFAVYVDGNLERKRPGLVGLLSPGPHQVELRPAMETHPYDIRRHTVVVEAGKTVRLETSMPWKKGTAWEGWTAGTLVGGDYGAPAPCLQGLHPMPYIQADPEAIRLFWSHRGDLWCAQSTDGDHFTRPRRLGMPISSGWIETDPICFRDESGRFVMTFLSDRDGQHQMRAYFCWSRDGIRWSSPAMIEDRPVGRCDAIQDDRGNFIWAAAIQTDERNPRIEPDEASRISRGSPHGLYSSVTIMKSRDGYCWTTLASLPIGHESQSVRIFQGADGGYELYAIYKGDPTYQGPWENEDLQFVLARYRSRDGVAWSPPQQVTRLWQERPGGSYFWAGQVQGRTTLAVFRNRSTAGDWNVLEMLREDDKGQWSQPQVTYDGVASPYAGMAYHPRWGYLIAWQCPADAQFPQPSLGPYLIRGKSIEGFIPGCKGVGP
jgi:TolB-like protein